VRVSIFQFNRFRLTALLNSPVTHPCSKITRISNPQAAKHAECDTGK
jgi:hypothetical protein